MSAPTSDDQQQDKDAAGAAAPGSQTEVGKGAPAAPVARSAEAKPMAGAATAAATPKPAETRKPAETKKPAAGEASPNAPRPTVVFGGIQPLKIEDIVVPFEYVVKPGETVESIAVQFYGSRAKARLIRDANPALAGSAQPSPGQKIKVPHA